MCLCVQDPVLHRYSSAALLFTSLGIYSEINKTATVLYLARSVT